MRNNEAKLLSPEAFLNRKMYENAFSACPVSSRESLQRSPHPLAEVRAPTSEGREVELTFKGMGGKARVEGSVPAVKLH